MRRLCVGVILAVAATSCSGGASNSGATSGGAKTTAPPKPATPARLVVAIVYDQFPSWAFAKYRELLSPDGALRRTAARGSEHVVEFAHAGTYTAAGHSAIFTGVPPWQSGISTNRVWSAKRGNRSIVDDGKHGVFGVKDAFGSPTMVKADSVADALRKVHGTKAKIVGLSYKDRGAILTTGRKPDLALWYEKKLGAMTSSSYYAKAMPAWVSAWAKKNPISNYYKDWSPADPKRLKRLLGPDDAPGEGDYIGFGTTFPHNPITTMDPKKSFRLTPQSTDHLLDLARASVTQMKLGADDVPDLLVLSVSSTDYIGHAFGPDSWEYVDHLIRIDAAVGKFLAELEKKTSIAVMITSDHGVAQLPERARHKLPKAGRIFPDDLPKQLNAAVVKELGAGKWVAAYVQPFVYLTAKARVADKRAKAVNAVVTALNKLSTVHSAYDVRAAAGWRGDGDALKKSIAVAIADADLGDVIVVPGRGSVVDEDFPKGKGTSHGSPWPYDRQVPAVFAGPGVGKASTNAPLAQNRVAATLCKLLRIPPPKLIDSVAPLPGL